MVSVADLGFDFPFMKEAIASIVGVSGFAYSCYRYGRRVGSSADKKVIDALKAELQAANDGRSKSQDRLNNLEAIVKDAKDFWVRTPDPQTLAAQQLALATSIPVICVLNLKGGVGKTTICANLAAYFAALGKRVLMIDFDYQGSLSDTVLTHARVDDFKTNAHLLLEGGHDPQKLRAAAERLSSIDSRLWIYPAFYDFSRAEIQMMFRWLVGQDEEIRFNLSSYLQSAPFKSEKETAFDMVFIDAPPRMLTGVVNALAASTDVLIPTILDGQSHIATLNTITAVQQFRRKLNPSLRIMGIVPSMVSTGTGYNQREQDFIGELERRLPEQYDGLVPILKAHPIVRREELAKAGGSEILYRSSNETKSAREVRGMFDELGQYVNEHVRWQSGETGDEVIALPGQSKRRVSA